MAIQNISHVIVNYRGSSRRGKRFQDLPTELVWLIASELPTHGIACLSLTCRKIHEDVKAILHRHATLDIHLFDPKLALFQRSFFENQYLLKHLRSLHLRFLALDPDLYRPRVTMVATIPRTGAGNKPFRRGLHEREELNLRRILQGASGLRHLNIEIFGDMVPSMYIRHGFKYLKTLHLGRFPHPYGSNVQNSLDSHHFNNVSMQSLVWIFELPQLELLSLHQMGTIQDVGLTLSSMARSFKIKTLVFKETFIVQEDFCSIPEAIGHFFAAFRNLEAVEWFLHPYEVHKLTTAAWIVEGLGSQRSTLRRLALRENNVITGPYNLDDMFDQVFEDTSAPRRGVSLAKFTALESLTIVGEMLTDSRWSPDAHRFANQNETENVRTKLPKSLRRLILAPFAWFAEPALYLAANMVLGGALYRPFDDVDDSHASDTRLRVACSLLPSRSEWSLPVTRASMRNLPIFVDTNILFRYGRVPTIFDHDGSIPEICENLAINYWQRLAVARNSEQVGSDGVDSEYDTADEDLE
ncbi:hypothetical protein IWX49DRAFT_551749 [Phyllosticta citricarpa]|uniref:F-box domain-containing protein n=1 Tax=Phyllosticta citricarpa TaxID=55181 RepID=A0ABR1M6T0_9PEZI